MRRDCGLGLEKQDDVRTGGTLRTSRKTRYIRYICDLLRKSEKNPLQTRYM